MKKLILFTLMTLSLNAFANSAAERCTFKAVAIATALDKINDTSHAKSPMSIDESEEYNVATMTKETKLTYSFGNGESILEVKIKPDYNSQGDCVFESSVTVGQE